jgi:hypothetical protein
MAVIKYTPALMINPKDFGVEVAGDTVSVPEGLRGILEKMGVRTADAFAAALQSFPTAMASQLGMDANSAARASQGALEKLRLVVDKELFGSVPSSQRRGLGALPPGWLKRNGT